MMGTPPPQILCVGILCLDIINYVDHYPLEDEDVRAKKQTWQSGGNCTNTSKVLALLGRRCEFLGTLGAGMEAEFGVSEFDFVGVAHQHCPVHKQYRLPTSYVTINMTNGSRTIVHFRNLPELTVEEFMQVDIRKYGWIHFEGRNPVEYKKMIAHIRSLSCPITVSVEIEKKREELLELAPLTDVLIVSKDVAEYHGCKNKVEALHKFQSLAKKGAVIVCPWSADGAAATGEDGKITLSGAYSPKEIVDTLGAGDTFNAGLIHSLSMGKDLQDSVTFACKLAGMKCGMSGYSGLKSFIA